MPNLSQNLHWTQECCHNLNYFFLILQRVNQITLKVGLIDCNVQTFVIFHSLTPAEGNCDFNCIFYGF